MDNHDSATIQALLSLWLEPIRRQTRANHRQRNWMMDRLQPKELRGFVNFVNFGLGSIGESI